MNPYAPPTDTTGETDQRSQGWSAADRVLVVFALLLFAPLLVAGWKVALPTFVLLTIVWLSTKSV